MATELAPAFAFADERRLPVIVHAGRGIPTEFVDLAGTPDDLPARHSC